MDVNRRAFAATLGGRVVATGGKAYDIAVIGAGVFGAWIAYFLQRGGKSVALVDAYGPANSRASSGGESRVIRMGYGADEIYTRWSMRSLGLWTEFFAQVRQPLFHRTGVLWIGREDHAYTLESRRTLQKCGVTYETLGEKELSRRYSQIVFAPGVTGTLEPESGVLMARRAVQAVVEACIRLGCEYLHEAVAPPERKRRLEYLETTSGSRIRAGGFVFACGPWLGKMFPHLLGKRLFPTRQEVFFFGVPAGDRRFAPSQMPVWIDFCDESGPYGLPDLDGRGFKLAFDRHGGPFDPDSDSRQVSAEGVAQARRYLARHFPALAGAALIESRVCQYENTSSGDFLIDRHPESSNVWLIGGGSGHGFKHGPALGEYASSLVSNGGSAERRFSLASKDEVQRRAIH